MEWRELFLVLSRLAVEIADGGDPFCRHEYISLRI